MEILNNIWQAFSTENELLLNIIIIPIFFVEAFIIMVLFTNILKINTTKKQHLLFTIIFGCVSIFTFYFIKFNIFVIILSIMEVDYER